MWNCDQLLAVLLLTTPLEPADLGPHLEWVKPAFLKLAVEAEILDPREEAFFEGLSNDPAGDVGALKKRYADLRTAPRLAECDRFPNRKVLEEMLAFNRAYRKDLVARLEIDVLHAERLRTAINEVDQLYQVWVLLRDARCRFYYVTARRQSLAQLQDLVGPEAFHSAQLPPHVPYWHFPRAR